MRKIALAKIRTDGGTQSRAKMNEAVIEEYKELYQQGVEMPPVVLFDDDEHLWLGDGFQRLEASARAGLEHIQAEVKKGTQRDAILYAVGANGDHGLRRTQADKRHSVEMLLADREWKTRSDRWVAKMCQVSHPFVADVRVAYEAAANGNDSTNGDSTPSRRSSGKKGGTSTSTRRQGQDGRSYPGGPPEGQEGAQDSAGDANSANGDQDQTTPAGEPQEPVDATGAPIPKGLQAAFCDPWIPGTISFLEGVSERFRQERVADGISKRQKKYPWVATAEVVDGCRFVIQYLDQLIEHFQTNQPTHLCPMCEGRKCSDCRAAGMVPAHIYKELKKLKREAEKQAKEAEKLAKEQAKRSCRQRSAQSRNR